MPRQRPGRSKQDYATPRVFIDAVKVLFRIRRFAFDFAADQTNTQAQRYWDVETDALAQPALRWREQLGSGVGWLNPPYAHIGPWAERCLTVSRLGGRVLFLVPASVGSNWYRDAIHEQFGVSVLFLNGRIPFIPGKPDWLYPKDLALIEFGTGVPFQLDIWRWRE